MKIRIPEIWDRFEDWINVDVVAPVRRIDVFLAAWGIGSVVYYSWVYGWRGGLSALVLYGLMLGTGLMLRG